MDYSENEPRRTIQDLQQMQSAPLGVKIGLTIERLRNWVDEYGLDGVCVSFSGGKDSSVLLDIARKVYPNIKAVYVDTGLEYPDIREWVKQTENVKWIKPKYTFKQVLMRYGYPLISKEVSEVVYGAKKHLKGGKYDEFWMQLTGQGNYQKKPTYQHEYEVLMGLGKYQKPEKPRDATLDQASLEKLPYRVKELTGLLKTDGSVSTEVHPRDKDYSQFNKEKYQFFLEDGAPPISSMCCNIMKKGPIHNYQNKNNLKPITAQMASESRLRTQKWLQYGCNGFNMKSPISNPMAFWTEQDILQYIYQNNLPICPVYGKVVEDFAAQDLPDGQMDMSDYGISEKSEVPLMTTGCQRTGCVFCGYGCHLEKSPNRFERLAVTHPALFDYVMRGGAFDEKGDWRPDNRGLGYWYCFEWINVHGGIEIKYPNREHFINTYSTEETKKYLEG